MCSSLTVAYRTICKLQVIYAKERRIVASIAPVVLSPRCWLVSGEHGAAGMSAGKWISPVMECFKQCFTIIRKYRRGTEKNAFLGQKETYSFLNVTQ